MRATVATLLNDGEGRMWAYEPDDRLVVGPVLQIDVPDVTAGHAVDLACDKAWEIGNREAADADGTNWPSTVRSLSAGDALIVTLDKAITPGTLFARTVDLAGFGAVEAAPLLRSLLFGKASGRGAAFAYCAAHAQQDLCAAAGR